MSATMGRLRVGLVVFYVVALAVVLAAGNIPAASADEPSGPSLQGPVKPLQNDKTISSAQTTQSDDVAQTNSAAKSTTPAKSKGQSASHKEESKSAAAEPAKKSAAAKSEVKSGTGDPQKQSSAMQKDKKGSADAGIAKKSTEKKSSDKKIADKKPEKDVSVGEPLAAGMVKLLQDEISTGVRRRGVADRFTRFQSYAAGRVGATSGKYTGSELTGNCRLRWYNHLMRNVLAAPAEAEQFTREMHTAACDNRQGLGRILAIAAEKMDIGKRKPRPCLTTKSADEAIEAIKRALTEVQISYCAALAPLSKGEIRELLTYSVPVLCTQNNVGHTIMDRSTGRRLCDLMERMDRTALYAAAEALAPLADVQFLEQLKSLPASGNVKVAGVSGTVVRRIDTPSGAIVIGGKEGNAYQLEQMRDVAVVIDLGGGNTYLEGAVGLDRPVLLVINLGGNNVFRGSKPGIQGGALLGVSMVLNTGGNNVYEAYDIAQGSAIAGVGIVIDYGPKNRYRGVRRVQGQALGGIGILIGRGGQNDYHAALWAQGMGAPLGFGLLDNVVGNNHYYCGGMWRNSYYPETPGYEGWGQGVGAGIRQVASGGIGVILDGGGENTYEFDYLAHGGGYWCGLGFARDFGGNTKRMITRKAYNGGPRTQTSFQRFGSGWGCHYAMGFLFDDSGDDLYEGTIMGTGMAWDCSMGVLCDFAGNDHYTPTGGLTQGTGGQMGFGVLFDYNGDDTYEGYGQGYASSGISYHKLPYCGGNFGFMVDYGGKDTYGCGANNNDYIQRGDSGGFLIDRPQRDEVEPTAKKTIPGRTAGLQ